MLRDHPDVLSLSEFFASISPTLLTHSPLSGAEFWRILAEPQPTAILMTANGIPPEELLYPLDGSGRFAPQDIPPIALTVLPHLTDDPDGLFDELAQVVPTWPVDAIDAQLRRLFAWLAERFDRSVVVERSGAALEWLPLLYEAFPDARFVHMIRDGAACAVSMSRHPVFRINRLGSLMARELGFNPFREDRPYDASAVSESLRPLLPDRFDVEAYHSYPFLPEDFGWVWSALVMAALPVVAALPPEQLHTLRYEELTTEPGPVLEALADFLGLDDPGGTWAATAGSRVDPARAKRSPALADSPALRRSVSRASRSINKLPSSAKLPAAQ
jgi:hypothetical protein